MRTLTCVIASFCLVATAFAAPPVPLRAGHPMLGNWKFTFPDGSCTETHLIRPDGTTIVTSRDEVSESIVDIDDQPDASGWYRWTDQVVRDNGKPDCAAHITPPGDVATTFARFDASGDRMLVCFDHEGKSCFGPLVRVRIPAPP